MSKRHVLFVVVALVAVAAPLLIGCGSRQCYQYRIKVHTGTGGLFAQSLVLYCTDEYTWDGSALTFVDEVGREQLVFTDGHVVEITEGRFCRAIDCY